MNPRPLDIIIPIYRNADLVRACVDSLLENLGEIDARQPRLLLINDSPDDEGVNALLKEYEGREPHIVVLHNPQNAGFVHTVNSGLERAQGAGHDALLVNSDTVTFAGTLREIVRVAESDPQIAFVSPRSNNASICSLPHSHGGALPTPEQAHQNWLRLSRTMPALHFTPTVVGFYMYVSHTVLANFGGLNPDFGVGYEEENDLIMRAGKVGLRAVVANHSFAYHAGSASFSLTDLDIGGHKHQNLRKLTERHPEFLPLVRRYESSARYRAEHLMGGLLDDPSGRVRVVFDLTGLGCHHNGTNEHTIAVVRSLAARWADRIRLSGIGIPASFKFHGLDTLKGLHRLDPGVAGQHAVAIRMAQPFDLHHLNVMETLAPINVFAMLDTIAEDCGPLAVQSDLGRLWDHVARHANGLLFNSLFSQRTFCCRHADALQLPQMASLLPTRVSSYPEKRTADGASHVLILGNHFPHKGSDAAASRLTAAFPTIKFVVLGAETFERGNLTSHRSGTLDTEAMESLFLGASVVVLPSYVEGFGLGFMHALAAGRSIVARRIPAIEEILATLDDVRGVFLYDSDPDLVRALTDALRATESSVDDRRGGTWDDWSDAVADFCLDLLKRDDLFDRLVRRIEAGDLVRKAALADRQPGPAQPESPAPTPSKPANGEPMEISALLRLEGRSFVESAYATLLGRPADESGLASYTASLESGVEKSEIVRALATSPEGRARTIKPAGLDALLAQSRGKRAWLKRWFNP